MYIDEPTHAPDGSWRTCFREKKEKNVRQLDIIYDHLLHIYVLLP